MSMSHVARSPLTLAIGLGLAALVAQPAAAADRVRTAALDAAVAPCDDASVLASVSATFARGSAAVEKTGLTIAAFGTVRTQGVMHEPSPMPRRWCYAPVTLSDGSRTTASWRIDRSTGFAAPGYAGIPDSVESCVLGHDRWRVHDGACRTARRWW